MHLAFELTFTLHPLEGSTTSAAWGGGDIRLVRFIGLGGLSRHERVSRHLGYKGGERERGKKESGGRTGCTIRFCIHRRRIQS